MLRADGVASVWQVSPGGGLVPEVDRDDLDDRVEPDPPAAVPLTAEALADALRRTVGAVAYAHTRPTDAQAALDATLLRLSHHLGGSRG